MSEIDIIGHPVGHSKSPAIHNAVFRHLGVADLTYGARDIATPEEAEEYLRTADYPAATITMPYKPVALRAVDIAAASAKLAGGVNVIVTRAGKHLGYNIDGTGMVDYLEHDGYDFNGKNIVVCGTGPTSLSCLHAMAIAGAASVTLVGRDRERARTVLSGYVEQFGQLAHATLDLGADAPGHRSFRQAYEETEFLFGSYDTSTQAISAADFIADATPLGMNPDDPASFPASLFRAGQTVFDTVYGAQDTAFIAGARAAGCTCYDGRAMLLGQAVISQRMWLVETGLVEDLDWDECVSVMRAALEE